MLGLLLSPGRITSATVGLAVVAGLVLTFVARPLSVLVSSVVQPMPWRELAFLSWAGLRGAVPIVLATIPLAEGVDGADQLFDIVFVMVVIYTLLTGPTLPWVARVLRVARRARAARTSRWRRRRWSGSPPTCSRSPSAPVSRMHGVEVGELRLPVGASVALVVRDGRDDGAGAAYRPAARRRPAGGHAAQAAGGDRAAAAAGRRAAGWRSGWAASSASSRLSAISRAAASRSRCRARHDEAGALDDLVEAVAHDDGHAGAGGVLLDDLVRPGRAGSRRGCTAGFLGSGVQICTNGTLLLRGRWPCRPRGSPAVEQLHGLPGEAEPAPGVVDAHDDLRGEDLVALGDGPVLADRCAALPGKGAVTADQPHRPPSRRRLQSAPWWRRTWLPRASVLHGVDAGVRRPAASAGAAGRTPP